MKYALLIGINYLSSSNQLNGCINDVNKIKHLLTTKYGYSKNNIKMLTDHHHEKPTFHNIQNQLQILLEKSKFCSEILFHYSGHGSFIAETNDNADEIDKRDECLVPIDFQDHGVITDDFIKQLFVNHLTPSCKATIIIDACHSGTCFDLPFIFNKEREEWEKINDLVPNKNIIMLSGCKDEQTSSDAYLNGEFRGALTFALISILDTFNYKITWKDLLYHIQDLLKQKHFTQKPQLSTSDIFELDKKYVCF